MMKFRMVLVAIASSALVTVVFCNHIFVWVLLIILFAAITAYGSANISSGFFLDAICHGDRTLKKVALTFDDGPDPEKTPEILDLLSDAGIKAGFFCIGAKIQLYPALVSRISGEGHLVGNHTFNHRNFFPLKPAKIIRKEITDTGALVEKLTGKEDQYFRPPFGVTNPLIAGALKGLNYKIIGWSIRSFDLSGKSAEIIVDRIISKLRGGEIILMHDTSPRIIPLLKLLIKELKIHGWEIVRFDELINHQN